MKKLLFALLCAGLCVSALAQSYSPIAVSHAATGRGVVSPGCAAVIRGNGFTFESFQALQYPLPTTLGGVTVRIGDAEAKLYAVSPTEIRLIIPDQPRRVRLLRIPHSRKPSPRARREWNSLSVRQQSLIRWLPVEVQTISGRQTGWAVVSPTAPGFYEQLDIGGNRTPQGQYVANSLPPRLITDSPIPNANTTLMLTGTGFRQAKRVQVFISDEGDGFWIVEAAFASFGLFDWVDQINFQLPSDAHGRLTVTAQADAMWSQQIQVVAL